MAAENWSREHVGRSGKNKIRKSFQSEVEVHIYSSFSTINRDFARRGNVTGRADRIVNIDNSEGPSRHLRCCGEAAIQPRKPEADAALIS